VRKLCFLVLLAACSNNSVEQDTATTEEIPTEEEIPSEYIFEDEDEDAPLSLGEVEEAILQSFEVLQNLNTSAVHDAYAHIRDDYGETCPYFYDSYEYDNWRDNCETEEGSVFSGSAAYWRYQNFEEDGHWIFDDAYFSGDAKVTTAEGDTFFGSGYSRREIKQPIDSLNQYQWQQVYGEFGWSGAGGEGTWIKEDYSVDFHMWNGNYNGNNLDTYTGMSGGLSGLTGPINTILLRDMMIYGDGLGSECAIEPYGTVSVRDAKGNWIDVVFDGPAYWGAWAFKPHCDGCGTAFFRGKELGPACIDFTSWMDWEHLAW